ncbi:MAG: lysophospholipid acyltransferase family protein [Pseudomonadales bacterium]
MSKKQTEAAFSEEEVDELIEKFLAIEGPDEKSFSRLNKMIKGYFAPTVVGLENVPDEPTLFIGNHAMFGLDGMILLPIFYYEVGRFIRAMGDNAWFQVGNTGDKLMKQGMVLANPKVCSALMRAGHSLLVFPGGAAEANKTAAEKYSLVWRERYGFVRMAAQHGYDITPFGLVGPDDWYDHRIEGNELLDTRLGKLLTKMGMTEGIRDDLLPPIPSGIFSTLLPKPEPCYLAFGEPINVPDCSGKEVSSKILKSVRAQTADRVNGLVRDMLLMRAQQKHKQGAIRRMLTR